MEWKTPTAQGGRGLETLAGGFNGPCNLATFRAQHVASRYALPIEQAALVAALAFGSPHHG